MRDVTIALVQKHPQLGAVNDNLDRMGKMIQTIDLNSDLGEGFGPWTMGDDAAMLDIVTSANIACGGHAGDPAVRQPFRQARSGPPGRDRAVKGDSGH